jgi:predicted nucleotide-binding protein
MRGVSKKLEELIGDGFELKTSVEADRWGKRVHSFLKYALGEAIAQEFADAGAISGTQFERIHNQIGMLEGLAIKYGDSEEGGKPATAVGAQSAHPKRVFVVHGHDAEIKETVARFLERAGLEPVILHEQPDAGDTVIEKFERHADVRFAVVLLTPDDIGGPSADASIHNRRARQNVVFELGYFVGRLSRQKVCALFKKGVEIPSDYQGVLFVEFDSAGTWRGKLAKELKAAGFTINQGALLKA